MLLGIAAGGWWAYTSDGAAPDDQDDWTRAAPRGDEERDGFASAEGSGSTSGDGGAARDRPGQADRAASAPATGWQLQIAPARLCGGAGACEVTIGFASGERARFAVRAQTESSSTLVPLGGDGGALLDRYGRARIVPRHGANEGISIVSPGGRRWVAVGGG